MKFVYLVLILGLLSRSECYYPNNPSQNSNEGSIDPRSQIFRPKYNMGQPDLNDLLSSINDFMSMSSQVTSHFNMIMTARMKKIGFFCKFQCKSKCSMKVWRKNCSKQCGGGKFLNKPLTSLFKLLFN